MPKTGSFQQEKRPLEACCLEIVYEAETNLIYSLAPFSRCVVLMRLG